MYVLKNTSKATKSLKFFILTNNILCRFFSVGDLSIVRFLKFWLRIDWMFDLSYRKEIKEKMNRKKSLRVCDMVCTNQVDITTLIKSLINTKY